MHTDYLNRLKNLIMTVLIVYLNMLYVKNQNTSINYFIQLWIYELYSHWSRKCNLPESIKSECPDHQN